MGLGQDAGPRDMVQAILEGVAFRAAKVVHAMEGIVPLSQVISVDGGMTRNPWFCQFLADCLGREIRVSEEAELTALGTALLAAEGAGHRIEPSSGGTRIAPKDQPSDWTEIFRAALDSSREYGARAVSRP